MGAQSRKKKTWFDPVVQLCSRARRCLLHSFGVYFESSSPETSVLSMFITRNECILHLFHSFRVYFFKACPAKMTVRIKKGRVRRNKKGQFTSLFHLHHSFRVNFSTSPLVSSVFFIFSTRFECGFSVNQKSNWFQTKIWFQCLLRTLKVKFSIHSSLQIRL